MSTSLLGGILSVDDRELLNTLIETLRVKHYPKLSADKYFELFSAEQVLKIHGYDLTPEQIRSGLVGSGGDGGIDSFYLFLNRKIYREDKDNDLTALAPRVLEIEIVCIQSKNKSSFEEQALLKFEDFLDKCLRMNVGTQGNVLYSETLRTAVNRFHAIYKAAIENTPKLAISFYYASLGEQIDAKVETRRQMFTELLADRFSQATPKAELIGAKKLFAWAHKSPSSTLTLNTSSYLKWTRKGKAYVCISSLKDFYEFVTENGLPREHIFESNVRDHERDTLVNDAIRKTLAKGESTDEFWWLNNGITIVASKIILDGDKFTLTDPMIVNGLQTSYEIANYFNQPNLFLDSDKRTIMVRIIETSEPTTVDSIINATNSQTEIPRAFLHATEQLHRDIEAAFKLKHLCYERRKNYYKNRGFSIRIIVSISELAQILTAVYLQKPNDARGRPTTVIDKYYSELFDSSFPFELYTSCGFILKRIEEFLDSLNLENDDKLNIKFYLAMYVVCQHTKHHAPTREMIASVKASDIPDDLMVDSHERVSKLFMARGGNDRVAKGPDLTNDVIEDLKRRLIPDYAKHAGPPLSDKK